MENIVINFTGDVTSLQTIVNHLEEVIKKEGDVGLEWKKTSEKIEAGNKANVQGVTQFSKSIESLALAAKTLDKNIIGGAYKDYLAQLKTSLGLTSKELIAYIQNARQAAQQQIFTAKTDQEVAELTLSIEAMNDQLKILGAGEDDVVTHTKSLRGQLQAMKLELAGLQEGTPEFIALRKQAGELDDKIKDLNKSVSSTGSDTRQLDGLIGLAGGVAGGYAAAQGAAALFGAQNEDVQKALLKVNAAMSILQGLQQIQNLLQKESSASLLFNTGALEVNKAARIEQATAQAVATATAAGLSAAEIAEAGAAAGATVASNALNASLLANPIVAVILSVVALYKILSLLSDNSKAAAVEQNLLNDAIRETGILATDSNALFDRVTARQLSQAKTLGASEIALAKIEADRNNDKLANLKAQENAARTAYNDSVERGNQLAKFDEVLDDESLKKREELLKNLNEREKEYTALYQEQILNRSKFLDLQNKQDFINVSATQDAIVAKTIAGSDAEKTAQIAAIRAKAEARKQTADFISKSPAEQNAINAQDEKEIQGLQLDNYSHYLKGRTALQEAYLAETKLRLLKNGADTVAEINAVTEAEIAALKKRRDEALKSDPNLNRGETRKIVAETNLQIRELERARDAESLARQKDIVSQKLSLTKKGSQEEHDLRIIQIDLEEKEALAAEKLTREQIELIHKNSDKKIIEADRQRQQAILQDQIEADNAILDHFGLLESEKLGLAIDRIETERQKALLSADLTEAEIAAIEAHYDKLTRDARAASIIIVRDKKIAALKAASDQEVKLNERILASSDSSLAQKVDAIAALKAQKAAELAIQVAANEKLKGLDENYETNKQNLINQGRDIQIAAAQQVTAAELAEMDKRIAKLKTILDIYQKGLTAVLPGDTFAGALSGLNNFGVQAFNIFEKLKVQAKEYNDIINNPDSSAEQIKAAQTNKDQANREAAQQAEIAAIGAAQDIINGIYAEGAAKRKEQLDADISNLEDQKAKELDNTKLTAQQKADVEARFKEKERLVKVKAFEADKQARIQQAIINGLAAIAATWAQFGFPIGIPFAVAQAVETAIIVSKIASTRTPKFKKGQVAIQGPVVNLEGEIPAIIHKGESVITEPASVKWKKALVAINDNHFESYLANLFNSFEFPHTPELIQVTNNNFHFDYNKMGDAIAGRIPEPVIIENNIDEEGLHRVITRAGSRTEYKNKRYTMRP